jgi:hypothetical protein
MKRVLLIADHYCVAGVVAALIADYIFNFVAEQISGFTLALIAPLSTK